MKYNIPDKIQSLPLPIISRMKLEREYILASKKVKKLLGKKVEYESNYYPLVRNNRFYGNEALLRKYANVNDYLYAIIEHGLYFGNNHQKVGLKHEWELGNILTYGEYRRKTVKAYFPDYYCETIGPMIHYAVENNDFKQQLLKKMDVGARTLLFFPVHGNEHFSPVYDFELTLKKIIELANKKDCKNIIVSSYLSEINMYANVVRSASFDNRIQIVSCGNRYSEDFLNNQKAMISLADLSVSNQLGTHLGFCIYMKKPHVLLPQDFFYKGNIKIIKDDFSSNNRSENWRSDFKKETFLFQESFNNMNDQITKEQYNLCDYYWGYTKIKSPTELKNIFMKCKLNTFK